MQLFKSLILVLIGIALVIGSFVFHPLLGLAVLAAMGFVLAVVGWRRHRRLSLATGMFALGIAMTAYVWNEAEYCGYMGEGTVQFNLRILDSNRRPLKGAPVEFLAFTKPVDRQVTDVHGDVVVDGDVSTTYLASAFGVVDRSAALAQLSSHEIHINHEGHTYRFGAESLLLQFGEKDPTIEWLTHEGMEEPSRFTYDLEVVLPTQPASSAVTAVDR